LYDDELGILALLKADATITYKALSEKMKVSLSTIRRIISKLKEKRLLVYVGNKRSGKWVILK